MKLLVLSDLHLELEPNVEDLYWIPGQPFPEVEFDAAVLAGDIHRGQHAVHWAARTFPGVPVILVPGNHEYYRGQLVLTLEQMREAAKGTNVTVVDNDAFVMAGVRFLGATLWTDFSLFGQARRAVAMREAGRRMNDFVLIRGGRGEPFTPGESADFHEHSRRWLAEKLLDPFAGKTVIITHHLPSARSIHVKYEGQLLNAAFASHVDDLMGAAGAPALWIHGHTHESVDYVLADTRVVCNPRGYVGWELNRAFRPDLIVEV